MKDTVCEDCGLNICYAYRKPSRCKSCNTKYRSEIEKLKYRNNAEVIKKKKLDYYYQNKERILKKIKENPHYIEKYTLSNKQYYSKYKQRIKKGKITRIYGLDMGLYEELLAKQKCKCPICNTELTKPCVDHSHNTGKIRGILCNSCNLGLGWFNDDIRILKSAISYLSDENPQQSMNRYNLVG